MSIHTESETRSAQIASLKIVTWTGQNFFLVEESLTVFQKKKNHFVRKLVIYKHCI